MLVRASIDAQVAQRLNSPRPSLIVPLDGSELAEKALPVAQQFARALDAQLILLGVILPIWRLEPPSEDPPAYLVTAAAGLAASSVEVLERSGEPAAEIATLAQERAAAAVVMATHGRTGVMRTVLGSVAGSVVHRSTVPVVLIHAALTQAVSYPGRIVSTSG